MGSCRRARSCTSRSCSAARRREAQLLALVLTKLGHPAPKTAASFSRVVTATHRACRTEVWARAECALRIRPRRHLEHVAASPGIHQALGCSVCVRVTAPRPGSTGRDETLQVADEIRRPVSWRDRVRSTDKCPVKPAGHFRGRQAPRGGGLPAGENAVRQREPSPIRSIRV